MAGAKKTGANKRKKTIKKRQKTRKEKVLSELEKMPIIEVAAKKAGISSSTFYRWQQEDSVFTRAVKAAQDKGIQYINDVAESKVISGIFNNDKTFVIFWLKNRHNNRFYKSFLASDHTQVYAQVPNEVLDAYWRALLDWRERYSGGTTPKKLLWIQFYNPPRYGLQLH